MALSTPMVSTNVSSEPLSHFVKQSSSYLEEAKALVSDIFCPHELNTEKTRALPKFQLNHVKFGQSSSLNYLKYGTEVTVKPGIMEEVFNVQLQLSGRTNTQCGEFQSVIQKGDAGILSPSNFVTMDWSENSSMLIYSVSKTAVEKKLQSILGNHITSPIVFHPIMDGKSDTGASFWRTLIFLQKELEMGEGLFNSKLAIDNFEQCLILSLLYGQPHNYSPALTHGVSMAAPVHVKRAEEYIRANAGKHITIEMLAEISGVSARTLFAGFQKFRNTSPMKYLKNQRMQYAREDLLSSDTKGNVTDIALKWGFSQLGRFSVEYKALFGESPSETLASRFFR